MQLQEGTTNVILVVHEKELRNEYSLTSHNLSALGFSLGTYAMPTISTASRKGKQQIKSG